MMGEDEKYFNYLNFDNNQVLLGDQNIHDYPNFDDNQVLGDQNIHDYPNFDNQVLLETDHHHYHAGGLSRSLTKPFNHQQDQVDESIPWEELKPLGLKLTITQSLLDTVQRSLSQKNKTSPLNQKTTNYEKAKAIRAKNSPTEKSSEKPKASNLPAISLTIGNWKVKAEYKGDLVVKFYHAKHIMVWEVLDGPLDRRLKSKLEIKWADISAIRATFPKNEPSILEIELNRAPTFYKEMNPQPLKHTTWQQTEDFTEGQAQLYRRHQVVFPEGSFENHYRTLLQSVDLFTLSQKPFPTSNSPLFQSNNLYGHEYFFLPQQPMLQFEHPGIQCPTSYPYEHQRFNQINRSQLDPINQTYGQIPVMNDLLMEDNIDCRIQQQQQQQQQQQTFPTNEVGMNQEMIYVSMDEENQVQDLPLVSHINQAQVHDSFLDETRTKQEMTYRSVGKVNQVQNLPMIPPMNEVETHPLLPFPNPFYESYLENEPGNQPEQPMLRFAYPGIQRPTVCPYEYQRFNQITRSPLAPINQTCVQMPVMNDLLMEDNINYRIQQQQTFPRNKVRMNQEMISDINQDQPHHDESFLNESITNQEMIYTPMDEKNQVQDLPLVSHTNQAQVHDSNFLDENRTKQEMTYRSVGEVNQVQNLPMVPPMNEVGAHTLLPFPNQFYDLDSNGWCQNDAILNQRVSNKPVPMACTVNSEGYSTTSWSPNDIFDFKSYSTKADSSNCGTSNCGTPNSSLYPSSTCEGVYGCYGDVAGTHHDHINEDLSTEIGSPSSVVLEATSDNGASFYHKMSKGFR